MQKELGLGDQDDSLVMMLQVTNIHAKFESGEGFFFLVILPVSNHPDIFIFQQRQKSREQNFNSFLSDLEAKYSKNSGKSKRVKK